MDNACIYSITSGNLCTSDQCFSIGSKKQVKNLCSKIVYIVSANISEGWSMYEKGICNS